MTIIDDSSYKGECLCGAIKYEVKKIEAKMANCHCSMCRKFHGSAYSTFAEAKIENFCWIEGESFLQDYVAGNGTIRQFCKHCGSSMTFASADSQGDVIEFALGTLDTDIESTPDAHVFTGPKANWTVICDQLPQYTEGREQCLKWL